MAKAFKAKKSSASKKPAAKKPALRAVKKTRTAPAKKRVAAKRAAKAVKQPAKIAAQEPSSASKPEQSLSLSYQPLKTMEKLMSQKKNKMESLANEMNDFTKDALEAMMQSSTIFSKRCEELVRESMSLAQNSAEKQSKLLRDAMSCKTLNEWSAAQNKLLQANLDDCMSGCTKLSEMSIKMLSEAADPINEQLSKGMQRFSSVAA